MRNKLDARIDSKGKAQKKRKPVPGGKALQRLFQFLGQRDPKLNDEVVSSLTVPKAARPKIGLTRKAMGAKLATGAKRAKKAVRPARGASPEAKKYALAVSKAANAISQKTPRSLKAAPRAASRAARAASAGRRPPRRPRRRHGSFSARTTFPTGRLMDPTGSTRSAGSPASRWTPAMRRTCCSVPPAAAFGKARQPGLHGRRAAIFCPRSRSAPSPSIRPLPAGFTLEAVKATGIACWAPAFTNRPTAERRGR